MKTLKSYTFLIVVFLWAPLLMIFLKGFKISAFIKLLQNQDLIDSLQSSLILAAAASILSTILATLTAFALPSLGKRTRTAVNIGLIIPMVLPEIAFGLAYLVWFTSLGASLGWTTLIMSHVAFSFCYGTIIMKSSLESLQWQFLDAAQDLGASSWNIFRHAILPQLTPGLAASLVFCFTLSLDDFLISFFVKGLDQVTLPIKIYSMLRLKVGEEIYALSVFLTCMSIVSVLVTQVWFVKSKKLAI